MQECGEAFNGIHYADKYRPRTDHLQPGPNGRVPGGQGVWDRDLPLAPYVVRGNPKSGLLPRIQTGDPGTPGEAAAIRLRGGLRRLRQHDRESCTTTGRGVDVDPAAVV